MAEEKVKGISRPYLKRSIWCAALFAGCLGGLAAFSVSGLAAFRWLPHSLASCMMVLAGLLVS
eukprot:10516597-Prorocentrum_lima.AAC.1